MKKIYTNYHPGTYRFNIINLTLVEIKKRLILKLGHSKPTTEHITQDQI